MVVYGGISISVLFLGIVMFGHENEIFEGNGCRFLDSFQLRSTPLQKAEVRMWAYGKRAMKGAGYIPGQNSACCAVAYDVSGAPMKLFF